MPLDGHAVLLVGDHLLGVSVEDGAPLGGDRRLVEVEEDGDPLVVGIDRGGLAPGVLELGDLVGHVVPPIALFGVLDGELPGAFGLQRGGVGELAGTPVVSGLERLVGLLEQVAGGPVLGLGAALAVGGALDGAACGVELVGRLATAASHEGDRDERHEDADEGDGCCGLHHGLAIAPTRASRSRRRSG